MSQRYECGWWDETGLAIVTTLADAEDRHLDEDFEPGMNILVIGDPWASAYAVFGPPEGLRQFVRRLSDFVEDQLRPGTETSRPKEATVDSEASDPDDLSAHAARRAAGLEAIMAQRAPLADAELAAHGLHPVSIAHGAAEDEEASGLIYHTLPALAEEIGSILSTRGGGEHTTFVFQGEHAAEHAAEFEERVRAVAPRWWRINRSATPRWR